MQSTDSLINENSDAVRTASLAAGMYLASINKTNLAAFEAAEWDCLLKTIIKAYIDTAVPF